MFQCSSSLGFAAAEMPELYAGIEYPGVTSLSTVHSQRCELAIISLCRRGGNHLHLVSLNDDGTFAPQPVGMLPILDLAIIDDFSEDHPLLFSLQPVEDSPDYHYILTVTAPDQISFDHDLLFVYLLSVRSGCVQTVLVVEEFAHLTTVHARSGIAAVFTSGYLYCFSTVGQGYRDIVSCRVDFVAEGMHTHCFVNVISENRIVVCTSSALEVYSLVNGELIAAQRFLIPAPFSQNSNLLYVACSENMFWVFLGDERILQSETPVLQLLKHDCGDFESMTHQEVELQIPPSLYCGGSVASIRCHNEATIPFGFSVPSFPLDLTAELMPQCNRNTTSLFQSIAVDFITGHVQGFSFRARYLASCLFTHSNNLVVVTAKFADVNGTMLLETHTHVGPRLL